MDFKGSGARMSAARWRPWLASCVMGPDLMAPVGQTSSQARGSPKGRSRPGVWQNVHFSILPATADNCGALNGQAQTQNPQPMQVSSSTATMPSSALLVIALTGQAGRHGASAASGSCVGEREREDRECAFVGER